MANFISGNESLKNGFCIVASLHANKTLVAFYQKNPQNNLSLGEMYFSQWNSEKQINNNKNYKQIP